MARTNGYSTSDLIRNPVLIAESLERDEIRCERDLIIDSVSTADIVFDTLTPLRVSLADYYNGAILVNVTMNERYSVLDDDGAGTLTLTDTPTGWTAGDFCYLKNIQVNVDTTVVDASALARDSWLFDRSLTTQQVSSDILSQLMFESHCIRTKSYNQTKIITLDTGDEVGTFTTPIIRDGRAQVSYEMTPLLNIYSDFTLNYDYDYAQKIYRKQAKVNKNSATDAYLDPMKTYCLNAEKDYKINKKYEYNSDWIHDDDTAYYLLEKLVLWFTYQRMILSWEGDIKTHIKYEPGDLIIVNYPYMMPTGKENEQVFIITYKMISCKKKTVLFNLLY